MASPKIARARAYVEEVHYRFVAPLVAEEPRLAANVVALVSCDLYKMAGKGAGHPKEQAAVFVESAIRSRKDQRLAASCGDMKVEEKTFPIVCGQLLERIRNHRWITICGSAIG